MENSISNELIKRPLLTAQQVAVVLGYKLSYIYWLTHYKQIPFNKRGKRLVFETEKVLAWYKGQPQQTDEEASLEAAEYNEMK